MYLRTFHMSNLTVYIRTLKQQKNAIRADRSVFDININFRYASFWKPFKRLEEILKFEARLVELDQQVLVENEVVLTSN